jgi:hypothetical protein
LWIIGSNEIWFVHEDETESKLSPITSIRRPLADRTATAMSYRRIVFERLLSLWRNSNFGWLRRERIEANSTKNWCARTTGWDTNFNVDLDAPFIHFEWWKQALIAVIPDEALIRPCNRIIVDIYVFIWNAGSVDVFP